jgi:rfaE bifunctional protein kinase chain/domain
MSPLTQELLQLVQAFSKAQVLVVGDLILDSYLECRAIGVANEAPVPFLEISGQAHALGGAANVAHNLARLGVKTILAGTIGIDKEGEIFDRLVEEAGIEFYPLRTQHPTSRKTRVQASGHYYLRMDEEDTTPLDRQEVQALSQPLSEAMESSRLLLVSDYDKGVLKDLFVEKLEAMAESRGLRIVGDVKPHNMRQWRKLYCITPNLNEARNLYSQLQPGISYPNEDLNLARELGQFLSSNVVLTLAEKGMAVATSVGSTYSFPALCTNPKSVSGAGDTVLATLAAALSCNADLRDGALLANIAAGIAVSHEGTYAVSAKELSKAIQDDEIGGP